MDPFLGEIRIFTGGVAPKDWMFCDGTLLPLSQFQVLFSIIGTRFGGDGKINFALPNLNNRAPMGQGRGLGLTNRVIADEVGASTVTLLQTEIPAHTHIPNALSEKGDTEDPTSGYWAIGTSGKAKNPFELYDPTSNVQMSPLALSVSGGSQAHNNMQPYLAVSFIICVQNGIYPDKS